MNREDIIRMARKAGFHQTGHASYEVFTNCIAEFAALIAAAEREACAKLVCSYKDVDWAYLSPDECSADIRARSST